MTMVVSTKLRGNVLMLCLIGFGAVVEETQDFFVFEWLYVRNVEERDGVEHEFCSQPGKQEQREIEQVPFEIRVQFEQGSFHWSHDEISMSRNFIVL